MSCLYKQLLLNLLLTNKKPFSQLQNLIQFKLNTLFSNFRIRINFYVKFLNINDCKTHKFNVNNSFK